METLKRLLFLVLVSLGMVVHSQTFNAGESEIEIQGQNMAASELNMITSQSQTNQKNVVATGNTVFINQIGLNNSAIVDATSNRSEINILQNGADNEIYSQISAINIEHNVVQNGDNNLFLHSNPFRMDSHKSNIIQNGNDQNLQWFGGNSISENMKVTMQGEGTSIIVRSFN